MSSVAPCQIVPDDHPSTAAIEAPPRGSEDRGQGGELGGLASGRYLLVDRAGSRAEAVALTAPVTHVGRAPAADVRLDDATVSARHAILVARPAGLRILDEGSTNGVLVNGRRVDEAELRDGDVVVLGRAVLTYRDLRRAG